jgi:hypothetical protein
MHSPTTRLALPESRKISVLDTDLLRRRLNHQSKPVAELLCFRGFQHLLHNLVRLP